MILLLIAPALAGNLVFLGSDPDTGMWLMRRDDVVAWVSPDDFRDQLPDKRQARQAVRLTRQMIRLDLDLWFELRFAEKKPAVITFNAAGEMVVSSGCTPGGPRWSNPDATNQADRVPRYGPARACVYGDAVATAPDQVARRFDALTDLSSDARVAVDLTPRRPGWTVSFDDDGSFLASAP